MSELILPFPKGKSVSELILPFPMLSRREIGVRTQEGKSVSELILPFPKGKSVSGKSVSELILPFPMLSRGPKQLVMPPLFVPATSGIGGRLELHTEANVLIAAGSKLRVVSQVPLTGDIVPRLGVISRDQTEVP